MVEKAVKEVSFEEAVIEEDVVEKAVAKKSVAEKDWECSQCGFQNFIARSDCFKCGAYRPLDDTFMISEGVPPKAQVG